MNIEYTRPTLSQLLSPVVLLAFLAGIASCYLTSLSLFENGFELCELFGGDCKNVLNSSYGKLFGVPVSIAAVGYSIVLIINELFCRDDTLSGKILIAALSSVALAGSLFFTYIMLAVIGGMCIFCLVVHSINGILFVICVYRLISIGSFKIDFQEFLTVLKGRVIVCFAPALIVVLLMNHAYLLARLDIENEKLKENTSYYLYLYNKSPLVEIPLDNRDEIVGDSDMASTRILVVYKEGCQHCERAKEKLMKIFYKNVGSVCLVFKNQKFYTKEELQSWGIYNVPAVFIDEHPAPGWDSPGFMNTLVENCDC